MRIVGALVANEVRRLRRWLGLPMITIQGHRLGKKESIDDDVDV